MRVPNIQDLQNTIMSAIESQFGTLNRGLRATYRTLSQVLAGQVKLLYLYGARIQRNIFPDQADTEAQGGTLERWGRARLGRNPFAATAGRYTLNITGIEAGSVRVGLTYRATNGMLYSVESSVTLVGTTAQLIVRSLQPGLDARLTVGDVLNATEPVLNVDQAATVDSELTTPLNAESIESYRSAVIQSFRTESQGGASGDYRIWADDAQGVREVYPFVGTPGNINLYVEANANDSTDGNGTPSQSILDEVDAVVRLDPDDTLNINERGRLPLGVFSLSPLPITTITINLVIQGYTGDEVVDRSIIENAIEEHMLTVRPFVAGADILDQSNLYVNRLSGAIASVISTDVNFTNIEMREGANTNQISVRQFTNGDIPILGTLTINA